MAQINQQISHENQMLIYYALALDFIKKRPIMITGVYIYMMDDDGDYSKRTKCTICFRVNMF